MFEKTLHSSFKFLRERFHPLFTLRKNKFFVDWIIPVFDVPIACRLFRVKWKVHVRLARNLSLVLHSSLGQPGIESLALVLSRTMPLRVFWDVGANIGQISWILMSENENLQSIMFEPDPDNASLIDKTITTAGLSHARLIRRAVSDKAGISTFAIDKASGATGSLITDQTFNERLFGIKPTNIRVETMTLDEAWKNEGLPIPDLVKIDVEMAEHLVFEGAKELLESHLPIVIFESCSSNKSTVMQLLSDLDYVVIAADYPAQELETAVNFLALPKHHHAAREFLLQQWRKEYEDWQNAIP